MKATTCACVAAASMATASAFVAPAVKAPVAAASSSALRMSAGADFAATLPGAPFQAGEIFDPLGFAEKNDVETIRKFREAEIKHGRVAMLAAVGILVAEKFHPLFEMPQNIGPAVFHFQEIEGAFNLFWIVALTAAAVVEGDNINKGWQVEDAAAGKGPLRGDYTPGDLGFDPLGIKPEGEKFDVMQTKELNNGRLAMIGVAGMLVQELMDGKGIVEHFA